MSPVRSLCIRGGRLALAATVGVAVILCLGGGAATGAATTAATSTAEPISVAGAWVAEVPPSAHASAAYMTIENLAGMPRILVRVSSPAARSVELHEMRMEKGMMRMSRLNDLAVPAHGSVELKPGGYHLMLIGLTASLRAGDVIPMTLELDDGSRLTITAKVRAFEGR